MYKVIVTLFLVVSLTRGNFYEILGISKSANLDEIRKAFKKQAIIHHPDKNIADPDAHDKFVRLVVAYEALKNNELRKKYDLHGEDGLGIYCVNYYPWSYYQNIFIYDDEEYVFHLERSDYYENVMDSDSSWFINFCSPLYSICQELASTWKKVAKILNGAVKIAAVDCEYELLLCYQVKTVSTYPTLLYLKKYSQNGMHYTGKHTQEAIIRFALDGLSIHIPEISESQWELFLSGEDIVQKPMLIFICNERNFFTSNDRLIVAATFDKWIDVREFTCKNGNCHDTISYNTHVVYLPIYDVSSWEPIFLDSIYNIDALKEMLLDQLLSPQELSDNDFEHIRKTNTNVVWLVCFYIGQAADLRDLNLQIKKFSDSDVNLGKINCISKWRLCSKLGVNRYPIWGILKPGGAFELDHEKRSQRKYSNINNDIVQFVEINVKTTNVRALSEAEALSILQGNNDEVWFLVWFTPRYPPCILFLSQLRKVSLEFDASIVRFGTIDCTIYNTLCRLYHIQHDLSYSSAYHTAMLVNGSNIYPFTLAKTAANVIQFVNEKRTPSLIKLTKKNFHHKLREKKSKVMWIVDYLVPRCKPCEKLELKMVAVAKSLNSLSFVNVAGVDCEIEASLCAFEGVHSYPNITMYLLENGVFIKVVFYNGQQDSLSILTWVTTFFPKVIFNLNTSNYQKLLDSKDIWVVDFYLPQCPDCQKMEPEFAIAAQKKQNRYDGVKIAATTGQAIKDEVLTLIRQEIKSRAIHDEL